MKAVLHLGSALIFSLVAASLAYLLLHPLVESLQTQGVRVSTEATAQLKATGLAAQGVLTDLSSTLQSVNVLVKDGRASLDDNYFDVKASIETLTVMAKDSDDLVHDLRASLTGGRDISGTTRAGLLPEASELLRSAKMLTDDLTGKVPELDAILLKMSVLESTLDTQIAAGGAGAAGSVAALTSTLADLDKLIASDDVKQILSNSAEASSSLKESAKSVDIMMRPLREKARLLKVILDKALGLVKFTFPL